MIIHNQNIKLDGLSYNLKDYIKLYNDFLEPNFCKKVVKKLNKIPWSKHSYNDHITNKNTQYENDLHIYIDEISEKTIIEQKISFALKDYLSYININWFGALQDFSPIRWNRYDVRTEMRKHCDHIQTLFDGVNKGVPILTILGSLNNNYEGGQLFILNDEPLDLKEGGLVIFPSNFLFPHGVKPVTKGIRYSYVSWSW